MFRNVSEHNAIVNFLQTRLGLAHKYRKVGRFLFISHVKFPLQGRDRNKLRWNHTHPENGRAVSRAAIWPHANMSTQLLPMRGKGIRNNLSKINVVLSQMVHAIEEGITENSQGNRVPERLI